jgi:hypothetical protein
MIRHEIEEVEAMRSWGFLLFALAAAVAAPAAAKTPDFGKDVARFVTAPDHGPDGAPAPSSVTLPVKLDNNRIFVEAAFRRRDGGVRNALVWVNFGVGSMMIAPSLQKALGGPGAVEFSLGGMPVRVEPDAQTDAEEDEFKQMGPAPVEAVLPAALWPHFRVTLDYAAHTLTLTRAETPLEADGAGVEVPIEVNPYTGVMAVDATIDGEKHHVVLDAGGGYSWMRGSVVRAWVKRHPDWLRAQGAVGQSNQAMASLLEEQQGTVVRTPEIRIGALTLDHVGVLGLGPTHPTLAAMTFQTLFWSMWGKGAPAPPVDGWIGGTAFTPYRITFDYAHGVSRWVKTGTAPTDELNSVPIALFHGTEHYRLGAVVRPQPGLAQAKVNDILLAIDDRETKAMTWGQVITALHGVPGEHRKLTFEREGRQFTVDAQVEAF